MQIDINNTLRIQSPYLFCQAAGSDGSDGTKQGIHLRWDLMKELGYNHIPKGNLAGNTTTGFNKTEDFVGLYRAQYSEDGITSIDIGSIAPDQITYLPGNAGIVCSVMSSNGIPNNIIVRFLNRALWGQILTEGIAQDNPVQDVLNRYDGIIEVEVENKLMFFYEINFGEGNADSGLAIETVSIADRNDVDSVQVIKRDYIDPSQVPGQHIRVTGENIKYFRAKQHGTLAPTSFNFNTYEDFFQSAQENSIWEKIDDFSLSLTDEQVFTWFQGEPYSSGMPHLDWPKYNDNAVVHGPNYWDRWFNELDGLRHLVQNFITNSDFDPRANINYESDQNDDEQTLTMSLLDMLKMVTLDYHGARMLGLGYLDSQISPSPYYMYAAVYTTHPELPGIGTDNDHVAMTIPTSWSDYRLPSAPELRDITYGLNVATDESIEPELLSDPNGYSYYEDIRYVNLNKQNINEPEPVRNFIPDNLFDCTGVTQPSSIGIEYKEKNESYWRDPEIMHDHEYYDAFGIFETITTPDEDINPFYVHKETEEGFHEYAIYAVNWFSRSSDLSNTAGTDNTLFLKRNTLLPPFNLAVQYIQEEDPLIFTTTAEQNALEAANTANPMGDNYKTRVTFEWDNMHHNAYQAGDKIEFFYREEPIQKVEGQIKSVVSLSTSECQVRTKSFTMASLNPPVVITPVITPGQEARFVGSLLNTPQGQFKVVSISQSNVPGEGPIFNVKKLVSREMSQATADEPIVTELVYTSPDVDNVFFVFENISTTNQWTKLAKTVDLLNFSSATEIVTEEDGSTHEEVVNGINGSASITEILDQNNEPTGGYMVNFFGTSLSPHPDSAVSWFRGSARFILASDNDRKKKLSVVSIQATNPISIVVYDPEYFSQPGNRIFVGNTDVNFHPGYKVYLSPQAGVFDKTKTMPAGSANNKKTYLAIRSADTTIPNYSQLTQPSILLARNVQKPVVPELIQSPTFATRPDFYGKSTYTMDIKLNTTGRTPFGIIAYRANEMSVLQTLYKPSTVTEVLEDLEAISATDQYRFNRWLSLVNVETDPADNNQFKLFGSYRFPNPDNASTEVFLNASTSIRPFPLQAGQTITSIRNTIKRAIEDVFSPLTETPVVFEYLKPGYQTSSQQPKTTDIVGRLLNPTDTDFNPYPMAVKFPQVNPNTVRFTDYTLPGNSRNIYFYFAREISVEGKLSDRTPLVGPVVLVDASPAEKPVIRRIVSQEENLQSITPAAVLFDLAEYISSENIKQYQVFRTTEFANAATVRTMQLASTIDAGDTVQDTFEDVSFPPFGQPLFYRVVALREILNEKGETEMIPSQPSEIVLTNIIDVKNPEAPQITEQIGSTQTNGSGQVTALLNVTLQWPQTTYNGTYYLYKMNAKGNWEKLWQKKTNAAQVSFPENGDFVTYPQTANLSKLDADGNVIYHRFKVSVENASGLFNIQENELVL